jgi:type III secretion protein Q
MPVDPTPLTARRWERLVRLGSLRTTRAHLALARRPGLARQLGQGLEAARAALGQRLGCPVTATARVREAAVLPESALGSASAFALLELSVLGAMAVLEIELPFLASVLERLSGGGSGGPGAASTLTRIEEAAFAFLALEVLAELRGREGFQLLEPRLCSIHVRPADVLPALARGRHLAVELALDVGGARGTPRLLLPAEALQAALARIPPQPPEAVAPEVLAAGLRCRAFAGTSRLAAPEARTLCPGDVVLFDDVRLEAGRLVGGGRLRAPGFALHGQFGPTGFSPTGVQRHAPAPESTMPPEPLSEDVAAALPVEVEVELTRLRVSLGELAVLKPGALLPLHIHVTEPVLLRVGDRAVARAELVEIDGEVGARVLALLS